MPCLVARLVATGVRPSCRPYPARGAHLLEALRTVDRLAAGRLERHRRLLAAIVAGRGVHLARRPLVAAGLVADAAHLARASAGGAAARGMHQPATGIKLLLAGRPGELLTTLTAR